MGLFKKGLKKDKYYYFKLFENIKVNLNKEQQNVKVQIKMICDNDEYFFYKYTPDNIYHHTYIIGQLKRNPKKVYYLGEDFNLFVSLKIAYSYVIRLEKVIYLNHTYIELI